MEDPAGVRPAIQIGATILLPFLVVSRDGFDFRTGDEDPSITPTSNGCMPGPRLLQGIPERENSLGSCSFGIQQLWTHCQSKTRVTVSRSKSAKAAAS